MTKECFINNFQQFGKNYEVFLTKSDGSYQRYLVKDLLPHSFDSDDLIEYQQKHHHSDHTTNQEN